MTKSRSAAVKKISQPTLEEEIEELVAQTDAMRERAEELLDALAEKRRHPNIPAPVLRRMWEARSLTNCPFRALEAAMKEGRR